MTVLLKMGVGDDIQQKGKVQTFWLARRDPHQKKNKNKKENKLFFLVGTPDLAIRKALKRVLDLLTVTILKRVNESITFKLIN